MKLLLDTNALLWLSGGSERLGALASTKIEAAIDEGNAAFSAISIWETALLVRKGRYLLSQPVKAWRMDLMEAGLKEAALDGDCAALAVAIELNTDDPADRFIAATAMRLAAQLVTSDQRLIDWANAANSAGVVDARL